MVGGPADPNERLPSVAAGPEDGLPSVPADPNERLPNAPGDPVGGLRSAPTAPSDGPPGGSIFNLDRPGAGLYLAAWFFAAVAFGLIVIALLADSATARGLLALAGFVALVLCFGSAGGYQIVARARRPVGAYRGPSPLIAFGFAVALSSLLAVLLDVVPVLDPSTALGFLVGLLFVFAGYFVALLLLVVRAGVFRWRGLARLAADPGRRVADFLVGAGSGLVAVLPLAFLGGLLANALDISAGDRFPDVSTGLALALVVVSVVLVAPLGEELFFRGFALSAWWADLGPGVALRRSAVFFAFVHVFNASGTTFREAAGGALIQFVVIFPMAVLLGILYERRGLAASFGAHMAYNAGVLGLALLATGTLPH
ncbi:MAG TPA: type II CAAX endopeptidase family protein [Candidatus Limnocylindrales bacterium]|nr:type II CAAX endopeptidase family protein [Candidatus Limnocylindrales bacterium]